MLIFVISKFRNIGPSTFEHSKFCTPPQYWPFYVLTFDNFESRYLGHSDFLSFDILAPTQYCPLHFYFQIRYKFHCLKVINHERCLSVCFDIYRWHVYTGSAASVRLRMFISYLC